MSRKTTAAHKPVSISSTGMSYWLAALLLIIPLAFSSATIDPVLSVRYLVLSLAVLGFMVFFIWMKKANVQFNKLEQRVFIVFTAGVIWSLVSTALAFNKAAGLYEVLRLALNLAFIMICCFVFYREDKAPAITSKAVVITAFISGLIGICQFYELAFTTLPGANYAPYGLMTNRNLFGSFLSFCLPFIIYQYFTGTKGWKLFSIVSVVFSVAGVLLSQTRSAWLAMIALIIVIALLSFLFQPARRKQAMIFFVLLVIGTIGVGYLLTITPNEQGLAASVQERVTGLAKGGTDSTSSGKNASERLIVWKKTLSMVKAHPVTGVGPANWKLMIPAYGTDGTVWALGKTVPDHVHNAFLSLAAEQGLPAVLILGIAWVMIIFAGLGYARRFRNDQHAFFIICMLGGIAAFCTDAMFSFPDARIEHSLVFLVMGASILGIVQRSSSNTYKSWSLDWSMWILISIAMLNTFMAMRMMNFEKHIYNAKAAESMNDYQTMISEATDGKNAWVNTDGVGATLQVKSSLGYMGLKQYREAINEANEGLKYNPNSAQLFNNLGTIYTEMGNYDSAIIFYEKARQITPKYDVVLKNLAVNYFAKGNYAGTARSLETLKDTSDAYLNSLLRESRIKLDSASKNK